jgi:hypothetical protein
MTAAYPSGPRLVWELAGRPSVAVASVAELFADVEAPCALCGSVESRTAPTGKAVGGNFTDQYLLARPDSSRICEGCVWVCSGKPPATVRMWTVVARPDLPAPPSHPKAVLPSGSHVHYTARNDMRWVAATLCDPPAGPWLVSVAESGQKHHAPYARVNHGAGRWTVRMDQVDVVALPGQFADVLARVVALRRVGFTSGEIETGAPSVVHLSAPGGLDLWRAHGQPLAPYRRSPLLHLACFLPKKEHLDEYAHAYPA